MDYTHKLCQFIKKKQTLKARLFLVYLALPACCIVLDALLSLKANCIEDAQGVL